MTSTHAGSYPSTIKGWQAFFDRSVSRRKSPRNNVIKRSKGAGMGLGSNGSIFSLPPYDTSCNNMGLNKGGKKDWKLALLPLYRLKLP